MCLCLYVSKLVGISTYMEVLVSGVCACSPPSVVSVVYTDWCRIVESLCMGPLYSL